MKEWQQDKIYTLLRAVQDKYKDDMIFVNGINLSDIAKAGADDIHDLLVMIDNTNKRLDMLSTCLDNLIEKYTVERKGY